VEERPFRAGHDFIRAEKVEKSWALEAPAHLQRCENLRGMFLCAHCGKGLFSHAIA
jgi:hypothetical protein